MKKRKKFKESKEFNYLKKAKGITLIALGITIVVLLILAAVSIATLTGENGILTRANEARENTEQAKEDELRKLTQAEAATNLENTTHTDNSTGEEKTVTIPAGFAVSQVDGENTIEDGLVIIDTNGNEFVYVEYEDEFYPDSETIAEDEKEFVESVNLNNGFWVSRYEIGNEGGTLVSTQYDGSDMWTGYFGGTAVSKKDSFVWNYITRNKAIEISNEFCNNDLVSSRLISNNAFDAILEFIGKLNADTEDCYKWGNYKNVYIQQSEFEQNAKYSTDGGITYKNIESDKQAGTAWLLTTGALEKRNEIKNIDGISGNISTWTTGNINTAIGRGSYYDSNKDVLPANYSGQYGLESAYYNMGFRIIIYVH